jgi:ATP-binding cassette, subfamily B, multidrug efflux pump
LLFGKYLNKYYVKYSPILLLGVLALVMVDYFQLIVPELYKTVVNGLNDGSVTLSDGTVCAFDMDFLLDEVCRPMILVIFVMIFGRFLWRICFFGTAIKVETDLRSRMFDRCKDLSVSFYQYNKVGDLMAKFINDLQTVQDCFGSGILMFFDALLLGVLSMWKMWNMNHMLTFLTLIPMILLLSVGTIVGKNMRRKWEIRQEAFSTLSDFSQESFSGISVIKAFVRETAELMAFRKLNVENENANVEYTKASTFLNIFVTLFVESVICVILGYGGYLVHSKIFNAGELIEFIGYFTAIVWPIMAVSQLIEMASRGKASLGRISALLDETADVCDAADAESIDNIHGDIEYRHLTFRYPDADFDALSDICLKISAGENIGIIGATGSGKTTLVDLLLRTYNVSDGTLFIDGHDVNKLKIKDVRAGIAYVPQDNFLFSDTIENNISFSDSSINHDMIEKAAVLSDIHDNITEFGEGYNTILGERGVTVSGGQKQRISIARAIVKNSPILILDDSVSAVDTNTEKTILENLRRTRKGKTTLLIAHRVTAVEQMDKVVFINDGKITAVGTHDELYNTNKAYHTMVELQRLDEEKEDK